MTEPAPYDVHALRAAEFPHVGASPYLNAASVGPLPERTRRAVDAYNGHRSRIHELRDEHFDAVLASCRRAAARLVGADEDEIALLPNTSHGINLAAMALPVPAGMRMVVSENEFPANVYPWMARARRDGVTLTRVPADALGRPDEDRILAELDRGDVAIFALSAVQFATGWHADVPRLGRFCRARGIRFVVDAIQSLGQIPFDVREAEVDVLATGGQKWLLSPFGTGFAYVRRELHESLEPQVAGWTSMQASANYSHCVDYRWEWVPDARRYEVATAAFQDVAGFTTSMELLMEVGIDRIRTHLAALIDPLAAWLAERGTTTVVSDLRPERRSGIFCFRPRDLRATVRALHAAGIVCVPREGAVRLSPHLYNTHEEMARVIDVLGAAGVA
jgi:cysteine desulfurase / selenocysteine lyase